MSSKNPGYDLTNQTLVGASFGDILRRVNNLETMADKNTFGNLSGLPEPRSPFDIAYRRDTNKFGVYVTMGFNLSVDTQRLKVVLIEAANATNADDFSELRINASIDDIDLSNGSPSSGRVDYDIEFPQRLKYNTTYELVKLVAIGSFGDGDRLQNPAEDPLHSDPPLATFTTPEAFGVPSTPNASQILFNRLDPTTLEYDAEFGVRVYAPLTDLGAVQSFGAALVDQVVVVLARQGGSPAYPLLKYIHDLTDAEKAQVDTGAFLNRGYVDVTCKPLAPGASYIWVNNICWANGQKKEAAGSVAFNAAGFQTDPNNLVSPTLTITSATDPYTADFVRVVLTFTQPSTVVALKWVKLERRLTSETDPDYVVVTDPNKLTLRDDEFHSTGLKTILLREGLKTKPSRNYILRCTIMAIGGSTYQFTQGFSTGANGAVLSDTAVPTLSTNPDTGTTGPTVAERHSKIDISCPLPSANINTLDNYQVVLQDANTTITGDPVVGVSDVLVIKYGQNPTFNLNYFADFGDQFYVRFRAHNSIGYSSWSAGTNQDGYSRPLQDFIGDAVPDNSEGLVRAGTGSGVSTTVFQLDGSASAVDDFYNGNAIHLTSPGTSSPDADTWRTITDYVGSTKQATLDTALSSTPGAGISFDIHAIGVTGDRATKSGTGHTATTFILESGLSVADDFFKGYTLYIPTMAAGTDRIRKGIAYNNTTKALTVDVAFGTAPSGNLGYLLINGSIGYSSPDNADNFVGIASPVPFRWYLNDADVLVYEILPPTGENAFSLTHFQIESKRRNVSMPVRDDSGAVAIVSGTGYQVAAPSGVEWASRIRFRNMFRDTGIDGWGGYSYYVSVLSVGDAPNYDPEDYGSTVVIDYQDIDSYPRSRYPIDS